MQGSFCVLFLEGPVTYKANSVKVRLRKENGIVTLNIHVAFLILSKNGVRLCSTHATAYKYIAADHVCQSWPRGRPSCALYHSLKPKSTAASRED